MVMWYESNQAKAQQCDFLIRPYGDSNPGYRLRRPRWYPDYIIRANSAGENLHYQHYSGLAHLWHRTGFLTVERFHSYPQCLQDHLWFRCFLRFRNGGFEENAASESLIMDTCSRRKWHVSLLETPEISALLSAKHQSYISKNMFQYWHQTLLCICVNIFGTPCLFFQ